MSALCFNSYCFRKKILGIVLRLSRLAEKARSTAGIDFLNTARIPRNRRPRCGGGIGGREPRSRASRNQRHALKPERRGSPAFTPVRLSIVLCLSLAARGSENDDVHRRPFSEVARPWDRIRPEKRLRKTASRPILRVRTRCTHARTHARSRDLDFRETRRSCVSSLRGCASLSLPLSPLLSNERKIAFAWPLREFIRENLFLPRRKSIYLIRL